MRELLRTMFLGLIALHVPAATGVRTAAAQDAAAYQKSCADCHPAPTAIVRKVRGGTEDEKKAYLRAFLSRHHMPDPAEVDRIISHLFTLPKK